MVIFTLWPLYPRERAAGIHWIGRVGRRVGLDWVLYKIHLNVSKFMLEIYQKIFRHVCCMLSDN